jgi:hypothetical protein
VTISANSKSGYVDLSNVIPFHPSVIIATAGGGNANYSRVTTNLGPTVVQIQLHAETASSSNVTRTVFWVAYK